MKIREFLKESLNNYPGKISSVVFSAGCDYKCPACHAKHILNSSDEIDEKEIFQYLDSRKGWIDGVVLCGGEPTMQPGLPEFAAEIRKKGLSVKLDTNGNNPTMIRDMLENKLLDYIAMDIKAPKGLYSLAIGKSADIKNIEESMRLLSDSGIEYEFRTTIAPIVRYNEISFISPGEAAEIAKWAAECTKRNDHPYYLQKFVAREKEAMLDEKLSKENLSKEMRETPEDLMNKIAFAVRKYLPKCEIR